MGGIRKATTSQTPSKGRLSSELYKWVLFHNRDFIWKEFFFTYKLCEVMRTSVKLPMEDRDMGILEAVGDYELSSMGAKKPYPSSLQESHARVTATLVVFVKSL